MGCKRVSSDTMSEAVLEFSHFCPGNFYLIFLVKNPYLLSQRISISLGTVFKITRSVSFFFPFYKSSARCAHSCHSSSSWIHLGNYTTLSNYMFISEDTANLDVQRKEYLTYFHKTPLLPLNRTVYAVSEYFSINLNMDVKGWKSANSIGRSESNLH